MPPRTRYDFTLLSDKSTQNRPAGCSAVPRQGGSLSLWQYRIIPALRLKHRSGGCGTASALPKCSIMSGCGTRIVLRGQKPLALCDRCPCFGSLFPPLAALTFAASSIICAFGLASAAPRSPYRHLELCGIALTFYVSVQRTPCRMAAARQTGAAKTQVSSAPGQGPVSAVPGRADRRPSWLGQPASSCRRPPR